MRFPCYNCPRCGQTIAPGCSGFMECPDWLECAREKNAEEEEIQDEK